MPLDFGHACEGTRERRDAEILVCEGGDALGDSSGFDYPDGALLIGYYYRSLPAAVAGFRLVQHDLCELTHLYVRLGYRGNGDGRRLLQATIDLAEQFGFRWMRVFISAQSISTERLFEEQGFRQIDSRPSGLSLERGLTPRIPAGIKILKPMLVDGNIVGYEPPKPYERVRSRAE